MDTAIYTLSYAAIALLGFIALKPLDIRLAYSFGLLFVLYLTLDDFATGLTYLTSFFNFLPGHWNWEGKIYSLLLSVVVILGLGMNAKAVGLVLPQKNIKLGLIALIPLVLIGVLLGLIHDPAPPSTETIAFQLLMPSAAEELAFRGIAPALLLGLVRGKTPPQGMPWIVVCIAAIPFGVVHGLDVSNGAFSVDLQSALWTLSGGIIYGWLRFSSGSLLFPLLAHSFTNVAFHLTALIGA